MDTWSQWNSDIEWVRLDGPFAEGASGTLKPKGGPKVRFVVEQLVPGEEFVDVSKLFGARLVFAHHVRETADGGSAVQVDISITGGLAPLWKLVLGGGIRGSAQNDLDALVRVVETSDEQAAAE